jgi:glycosyltransferase involved in cell wall biosynthesis
MPNPPLLDLVVPVYNEEDALGPSIRRITAHLADMPFSWRVSIVDNASTDGTAELATDLAATVPGVRAILLDEKGKGRAVRAAWMESDAEVLAYTDVDLSTDLAALAPLVDAVVSGDGDIAIGSRLASGARVTRGPKREIVSRSYNSIIQAVTRAGFTDAQCGFKALRADVARTLLPEVENETWFFDTELLLLAEHHGLKIVEVAVDWVDDPTTTVNIRETAMTDLRGLIRLTRRLFGQKEPAAPRLQRQVISFALVGVFSTILHMTLFLSLRGSLGSLRANAIALLVATPVNTALNRMATFSVHGRNRVVRDHLQAGAIFVVALAMTSLAIWTFEHLFPDHGAVVGVIAVLLANGTITLGRFLLLRAWVFNPARRRTASGRA